ncbi:MAG: PepSY-associated TM helix domain-containing protein [Bacteroidota bacterium]
MRRLNIATHRDVGYFFSSLIIIYCLSGIALNHIDDWNPDFIVSKRTIEIDKKYKATDLTKETVGVFNKMVGEEKYKVFDAPTFDQVKIYYNNATLHLNFTTHEGAYESITRRPVFYHANVLHKNSLKGWKWVSDVFAVMLILISVTGLFILKGKNGFGRRGVWLLLGGLIPPVIAWIIHSFI